MVKMEGKMKINQINSVSANCKPRPTNFKGLWGETISQNQLQTTATKVDIYDCQTKEYHPFADESIEETYEGDQLKLLGFSRLINKAGKYEIVPWTEAEYKIFNENIDKRILRVCILKINQKPLIQHQISYLHTQISTISHQQYVSNK